jgi:hypothetical protein
MSDEFSCAYGPCECKVSANGEFCSEACRYNAQREATHTPATECDCGHEACTAGVP